MNARRPDTRPRIAAAVIVGALAAGTCTPGGSTTSPSPPPSTPAADNRLRIDPAPFQLGAPVQREVAVLANGTIYLAGGLDSAGRSVAGLFSLQPTTGKLSYLGDMPAPFHDAAGAVISDRVFIFGGGRSRSTDTVQSFDLASERRSVAGHLPTALSDLASATVAGTVYLVGGYNGVAPRSSIYATTNGTRFRLAGRLPIGLRYAAVASAGTDIVIAGGAAESGAVSTIYRFDTTTGKTSLVGSLPEPVGHAACFSIGGKVYVAGGLDASGAAVADLVSIDPITGTVTALPPLPRPLSDAAAVSSQDGAWLIGGWRGRAVNQVLEARVTASPILIASAAPSPSAAAATPMKDPARVRPFAGLLLVADRGNNRLLVLNSARRVVWRYPDPAGPAPPVPFNYPDDAFWVHGGHAILVNEEGNNVLAEIAYPSGQTLWTYGHPRVAGSSPGYLHQPDDVYPYPGGGTVVADASNCRILFLSAAGRPKRQIGTTGTCVHDLPHAVGYPNGDTPLRNGDLLLSELDGGWVDRVTSTGQARWSVQVPDLPAPSDPQLLPDGSIMAADYASPGRIVRFTRTGAVLWSYGPTSGPGELDHPSLAAPLPNGLVALNDDYNHRVVLLDPKTNRIVWQYGHTNVQGTAPGYLNIPDGLDLLLPGGIIPLHVDFADPNPRPGRP